jgi:hypothetical protein
MYQPPTTTKGTQMPTTTKQPLPTYDWSVRYKDPTRDGAFAYIKAAYFQHEGAFFEFKDGHHKSIYMVATSEVLDIGRKDPNSDVGQDHTQ